MYRSVMRRIDRVFLALWVSSWAPVAHALSTDRDQPMEIQADSVEIDDAKHTVIYRGKVRVQQGTLRIESDELRLVEEAKTGDVAYLSGRPLHFRQQPDGDKEEVRGQSLRAEYFIDREILDLYDEAVLHQGKDRIASEHIRYDSDKSTVTAGQAAGGAGRVHTVIHPKKKRETEVDGKAP